MRRYEDLTPRHQASFAFRPERKTRVRHDHSKFRKDADWLDIACSCDACYADRHERQNARSPWHLYQWGKPSAAEYRERHLPTVPNLDVARFLGAPVDAERMQTRDQCRLSDDKAIKRAAKFLTLASEYAARKRPNPLYEPIPTYADWLVRVCHVSRKDAERFAAKQNADCRAIAAAERQAADVIALPVPIETPEYREAA